MGALVMGVRVVRPPFFKPHTWCAGIAWHHWRYRLMDFTKKQFLLGPFTRGGIFLTVKTSKTNTPYGVLYFFVSVW